MKLGLRTHYFIGKVKRKLSTTSGKGVSFARDESSRLSRQNSSIGSTSVFSSNSSTGSISGSISTAGSAASRYTYSPYRIEPMDS